MFVPGKSFQPSPIFESMARRPILRNENPVHLGYVQAQFANILLGYKGTNILILLSKFLHSHNKYNLLNVILLYVIIPNAILIGVILLNVECYYIKSHYTIILIVILSKVILLNLTALNVNQTSLYFEFYNNECHITEWHYTECQLLLSAVIPNVVAPETTFIYHFWTMFQWRWTSFKVDDVDASSHHKFQPMKKYFFRSFLQREKTISSQNPFRVKDF